MWNVRSDRSSCPLDRVALWCVSQSNLAYTGKKKMKWKMKKNVLLSLQRFYWHFIGMLWNVNGIRSKSNKPPLTCLRWFSIQLMSISAVGNILSNECWRSKRVTHDCCILSSSLGEYTHPQQLAPVPFPLLQLIETCLIYTFTHLSIVLLKCSCNLMEAHLLFVSVFFCDLRSGRKMKHVARFML